MEWNNCFLVWLALLPLAMCWTPVQKAAAPKSATSPYIDMLLCPIREQSWSCAREQSARILNVWDGEVKTKWQQLKVEADSQLNATLEKRGYSASEIPTKEKPSTILKKIEIGSNFMKEYLAETMDGFLGREYEYLRDDVRDDDTTQPDADEGGDDEDGDEYDDNGEENAAADDDDGDDESDAEDAEDAEDTEDANDVDESDSDNNEEELPTISNSITSTNQHDPNTVTADNNNNNISSSGDEFIEIADADADDNQEGQLKRPAVGGNNDKKKKNKNKRKNKNKNRRKKGQKGQHAGLETQPATLLLVQQSPQLHESHETAAIQLHSGDLDGGAHGGPHKLGEKRRKRKKHGQKQGHGSGSVSTVIVEEAPSNHIGVQLLEELIGEPDLLGGGVGGGKRKRKQKFPTKYGRSNGVTRGKKKKKRKALMKLVLLGSFLKAKIELLLKVLGTHLQIKFLAIALVGLLINIARFWIDVKRGGAPQKHHYEDHGDEWSEGGGGGGGGYWKRSLQTDLPAAEEKADGGDGGGGGYTDGYQAHRPQYDAHYLAYRSHWQ